MGLCFKALCDASTKGLENWQICKSVPDLGWGLCLVIIKSEYSF